MSSRRKQGRPQQRKTVDSLEQENDLLVCGDCQTSFPLQDIVQFIKHKNQTCNKENQDGQPCRSPASDDHDDGDTPKDLSAHKDKMDEQATRGGSTGTLVQSVEMRDDSRLPLRAKQVVDAEANTTHTEPCRFVCEACRLTVLSAWSLLQHAQKEHGMKIYNVGTTPPQLSPQPQPAHTRAQSHPPLAHPSTPIQASPSPRPSGDQRTTPVPVSSGHTSPFPGMPNPFTAPFRMPMDGRGLPPFSRPPELQLPMDLQGQLQEFYRLRPPHPSLETHFAHSAFDRSRSMSALESQIYSQRLKQLANTTMPHGLISPLHAAPFTSPVLTPFQPNARESRERGRDSVGSGRESGGCQEHSRDRDSKDKEKEKARDRGPSPVVKSSASCVSSVLSSHLPSKLKSCEFCGKMFRFQSNLIVHRRSHTGERPFRCPLCPHACTQQSKLKRHMKTHASTRNASLTSNTASSDGSARSTSSTPDSTTRNKLDDAYDDVEDDDDVDDVENEEEEEEEMEADYTDGDYESGVDDDSSGKDTESMHGDLKRSSSQAGTPDHECPPTPTKRSASASLVSEVMKNSGLNCIQSYNEAFQAALAEKFGKENGENEMNEAGKRSGVGPFLGKTDLLGSDKSIKREPGEVGADITPQAIVYSRSPFSRWPGLHDASSSPLRGFFPGFPPPLFLGAPPDFSRDSHNGFPASSDSALKVPATLSALGLTAVSKQGSTGSLLTSSNGGSGGGSGNGSASPSVFRKDSKRNDTCEFCGKVFKNCSNLTVHRRSHTGEKPYKCTLCNYACAQSSKLTRHMKTHGRIGKDVFKCKFCLMPFSVPSTLEKHMRKCLEKNNAGSLSDKLSEHMLDSMMDQDNSNSSSGNTQGGRMSTPLPHSPTGDEPLALDMTGGRQSSRISEGPLDLKANPSPDNDKDSKNPFALTADMSPLSLMLNKNPLAFGADRSPLGLALQRNTRNAAAEKTSSETSPSSKSPRDVDVGLSTVAVEQEWT